MHAHSSLASCPDPWWRLSPHVGKNVCAEGDTWQETLAVCEVADASKLVIRSYYEKTHNDKRVWDETLSVFLQPRWSVRKWKRWHSCSCKRCRLWLRRLLWKVHPATANTKEVKAIRMANPKFLYFFHTITTIRYKPGIWFPTFYVCPINTDEACGPAMPSLEPICKVNNIFTQSFFGAKYQEHHFASHQIPWESLHQNLQF